MTRERKFMSKCSRLRFLDRRLKRRKRGKPGADLVEEAVHLHGDRHANGTGKAKCIGAAMALHRDAAEAEEDRAVVPPYIEVLPQFLGRASWQHGSQPRR